MERHVVVLRVLIGQGNNCQNILWPLRIKVDPALPSPPHSTRPEPEAKKAKLEEAAVEELLPLMCLALI